MHRAIIRTALLFTLTMGLLPLHAALFFFAPRTMPRLWHGMACKIIGLEVHIKGAPHSQGQVLFVGNHLSHLDIPALGAFLPARFIAKSDVRKWPVFGFLAAIAGTVFISRNPRDARRVRASVENALARGDNLVLFAEGTSSIGKTVLPFRSSLFAALGEQRNLTLQPFTINLICIDQQKVQDDKLRNRYAYYGDMIFGPHLWHFLRGRGATLSIVFHAPLAHVATDRKALAHTLHQHVSAGLLQVEAQEDATIVSDRIPVML